jgi:peroxiredoxin Q/BCP
MALHTTSLQAGGKAPDFTGKDQDGIERKLSDYKGRKLVLYFYPQDDTPTCTKEACNLRDNYKKLQGSGYEILGVSPDTEKKHKKFIAKYELPFPLISDIEKKIIHDYDVWGEKFFMGRTYDGIVRSTFLIDEEGKIEKVISKVDSGNHADQILEKI